MACTTKLAFLQNNSSGCACLKQVHGTPDEIQLFAGGAANFPLLVDGKFFFATIAHKCYNILVKVTHNDVASNTLTVEWLDGNPALCIPKGTSICYTLNTPLAIQELANATDINVADPLTWDCNTRTIGVDCVKLKQMINEPCV